MAETDDWEEDYVLRPAEASDEERIAASASQRLALAALQSQYDAACEQEERSDEFSLRDLEYRFGIRHLAVVSVLIAISIRCTQRFGVEAGIGMGAVVLLMTLLYFIFDLQQQKRNRLAILKKRLELQRDHVLKRH